MEAQKRFSRAVIEKLRSEIENSGGNEVFAFGFIDEAKLIVKIEISARGNESAVPAIQDRLAGADVLIHNHPSGFLTPSDNDLVISSRAAENGTGSYIVDNNVENVYVVAEPVRRRKLIPLDEKKIISALEPGGVVSARLPSYEIRESQLDLMRLIIRGFNDDSHIAAEAGTGVGKSFAYLLPALGFADANDERIVISTATITLQEQLYAKDIPLVSSSLDKKIKTVLVKGRGNYVCLRRLEDAIREPSLDNEEAGQTENIARWAETTATGSRSDLAFLPSESVWSRVCSESDTCMNMRCAERERCFVMLLRREASDARILVVNHHLLFADLAARRDGAGYNAAVVLPPYSRVIMDEAHTAEDAATSFFSRDFSRTGINRQLGRLYRKRRARKSGILLRLLSILPVNFRDDFEDKIEDSFDKIRNAIDCLDEAALEFCGGDGVFRLTVKNDAAIRDRLSPEFLKLRKLLNSLVGYARSLLEEVPEECAEDPSVWEVRSVLRRLDSVAAVCTSFLDYRENQNDVMWIEKRSGSRGGSFAESPWAVFTVTPVDVAPYLKEALFEPNKTVVCVSATLTAGNSFDYWQERSGLSLMKDNKVLSGIFLSPFPYDSRVLLASPEDAPLPTEAGYGIFVDSAVTALTEISGGSALVLFTSYQALKSAHQAALPVLEKQGIKVFRQGDDDRNRLLAAFLQDESSVLFATDSFWEGVDAPGDTLRLVILCRLPFKSPNDPVFEARCEALENRGDNSFMNLSLPEAVMKFKQGFGRLMRRSSDHGVVVVLDGRLRRKRYGEVFIRSLPETKTCFGSFDSVTKAVENFLY